MTEERAIEIIKDEVDHISHHLTEKGKAEEFYIELGDIAIAFNMALQVLEQKSSGDLISRQAVINTIYANKSDFKNDFAQGFFADKIRDLPHVNPQPKTGHWRAIYQGGEIINYRCSECELGDTNGSTNLYGWDYCRRCGAKMVESQKSEGV